MARSNPVRAQYAFIGTLQCVGIRTIDGDTYIAREGSTASLSVPSPEDVLWVTQRSVNHAQREVQRAMRELGQDYYVDLDNPAITPELIAQIQTDKVVKYTTEDFIVKFCGGESPENRAYAKEQIAALNAYYIGTAKVASAA